MILKNSYWVTLGIIQILTNRDSIAIAVVYIQYHSGTAKDEWCDVMTDKSIGNLIQVCPLYNWTYEIKA